MCCMRLAGNAGHKKIAKKSPSGHHPTTLSGYIPSQLRHVASRQSETRRPASADRTARRQFQATGQPVSRTQASDAMTSRLPRYEVKCVQRTCFHGVGPFAFRYQGNRATPWQYIDTTRKAIDCAKTLPLTVFIQWNYAADFSSFIVKIVSKTTYLGIWSHFEEVRAA